MRRLHIDAKDDLVLRQAHRDQPVAAVAELVWNSLDAEANHVRVSIERDELDAVKRVQVEDDGHGIAPEQVESAFVGLGGSWKATARLSPNLKRLMNGRNGQGRIRGFALGDRITWTTVALDTIGQRQRLIVSGQSSDPTNFEIEQTAVTSDEPTGTTFVAKQPARHVNRLTADTARSRLTATFALFLTTHPAVTIIFDGHALDPVTAQRHSADYTLNEFSREGLDSPNLRIIEWASDPGRAIHLCDADGGVLGTVPPEIHTPGFHYTAYVMWPGFNAYGHELLLAELKAGELADLIAIVRDRLKRHFRSREAERRAEQVREWKRSGDYPYDNDPQTEIERAEREAFDYVATSVARKIPKSQLGRRTTLGLLKVAITNEPSEVPRILDSLLPLPKRDHEDLARLLDRTSMSKLIEANTVVTGRLDFLAALREMVFDPATSKKVKERKELHRLLAKELWVFGEEYALLASDRSLDEVLERHLQLLRPAPPRGRRSGPSTPVRRSDGSRGIVDLMLSQQRRTVDRREHLVVELKRPNVTITQQEVGQIKSYAEAVANDPQFHSVNAHWDFWVISTKLDNVVLQDARQPNLPPGQIADWDGNVRIWAKTWSEIIEDCEARLQFYQQTLEYNASREHAADYVIRSHDPDTVPEILRTAISPPTENVMQSTAAIPAARKPTRNQELPSGD